MENLSAAREEFDYPISTWASFRTCLFCTRLFCTCLW